MPPFKRGGIQSGCLSTEGSGVVVIPSGGRVPWHWRYADAPYLVSLCLNEVTFIYSLLFLESSRTGRERTIELTTPVANVIQAGWEWSGGLGLDVQGNFYVMQRNNHNGTVCVLRCDVAEDPVTLTVTLRPDLDAIPPYRVDNLSLHAIRVRQEGAHESLSNTVLPYHSTLFTWDDLDGPRFASLYMHI